MKLENISIVIVGTIYPGNVGAAVRVMNNMCINQLIMVSTKCVVERYVLALGTYSIFIKGAL